MADDTNPDIEELAVSVSNRNGACALLLVCEHASNHVPTRYNDLGIPSEVLRSHIAWDPGARVVAAQLSRILDAPLVASEISRLVFDCNRPLEAPDATPEKSERFIVPGNAGLIDAERMRRFERYYLPFERAITSQLDMMASDAALLTIHSFTPVYLGKARKVEVGILHDSDSRFADALLKHAPAHLPFAVERNEPYSAADGVTHTLKMHGVASGRLNAMLEIRNDLLSNHEQCVAMAESLANLIGEALSLHRCDAVRRA